jgi:hypothetical protein
MADFALGTVQQFRVPQSADGPIMAIPQRVSGGILGFHRWSVYGLPRRDGFTPGLDPYSSVLGKVTFLKGFSKSLIVSSFTLLACQMVRPASQGRRLGPSPTRVLLNSCPAYGRWRGRSSAPGPSPILQGIATVRRARCGSDLKPLARF